MNIDESRNMRTDRPFATGRAAVLLLALVSMGTAAQTQHDGHRTQQQAHVHGLAELTIALEGNALELNLESPAANIVGFERRASSPEQRIAVAASKKILETPAQLFRFIGTDCLVDRATVDVSAVEPRHNDQATPGHHDDEHDHDHDHDHDSHSEISANYRLTCAEGSKLTAISVDLLKHFSAIEKLQVQWISGAKQGAIDLSRHSTLVKLK